MPCGVTPPPSILGWYRFVDYVCWRLTACCELHFWWLCLELLVYVPVYLLVIGSSFRFFDVLGLVRFVNWRFNSLQICIRNPSRLFQTWYQNQSEIYQNGARDCFWRVDGGRSVPWSLVNPVQHKFLVPCGCDLYNFGCYCGVHWFLKGYLIQGFSTQLW